MSCDRIEPELMGYHFGALEDAARTQVEAHLPDCPRCLKAYLALKREVELGEAAPRPSAAVRARVMQSFRDEVAPRPRPWRLWERPLAFGFAGGAVFLAVFFVQTLKHAPGAPPKRLADLPVIEAR